MLLLIDGYNLLHAVGWATPRMPKPRLQAARRRLLDWLADSPAHAARAAALCVVFDAQHGPAAPAEQDHRGVRVRFAAGRTADDLIEELLAAEPRPAGVAVVSNDSRLQEAARRRGAEGWPCPRFLDWLLDHERRAAPAAPPAEPEKPDGPPTDADEELLRAFSEPKPRRPR